MLIIACSKFHFIFYLLILSRSLLDTFVNNGGVSGVILLERPNKYIANNTVPRPEELGYPSTLSWDTSCPNERYSMLYAYVLNFMYII